MTFPFRAAITKVNDGLGYASNDRKYIGPAEDRVVSIVYQFPESKLYLSSFFNPEFKDLVNDYTYHGFLVLSAGNFERLP